MVATSRVCVRGVCTLADQEVQGWRRGVGGRSRHKQRREQNTARILAVEEKVDVLIIRYMVKPAAAVAMGGAVWIRQHPDISPRRQDNYY